MEKKIIALCLIGLILLFGCVENNDSNSLLVNSAPPEGSDVAIYNSAVSSSDLNLCNNISNNWAKNECKKRISSDENI